MLHSGLATNPYALTAIVCGATFVVAPVTLTVYRYAAFLTLITFMSLILCQYKCASSPSSATFPVHHLCIPLIAMAWSPAYLAGMRHFVAC